MNSGARRPRTVLFTPRKPEVRPGIRCDDILDKDTGDSGAALGSRRLADWLAKSCEVCYFLATSDVSA